MLVVEPARDVWVLQMATLSILVDLPIVTEKLEGEDFVLLGGAAQAGTRTGRFLRLMRVCVGG